jgi:hypothetical protein
MYKIIQIHTPNGIKDNDYVLRIEDSAFIHKELNEAYLEWLAEGNTPEPADEVTP